MAVPATRRPRRHRVLAALATVSGSVLVLAGCLTGERPTLAEGPVTSGDQAIDAVLVKLDAANTATFTASYDVLTRFGDITTLATVVQAGPARRSVTIGEVRFLIDSASTATCALDATAEGAAPTCSDTIDAARVSDTQLTPDFYGSSAAARLRRDAAVRSGPTTASTETLAGQTATCVNVPISGGSSTYCALDSGALARLDAADLILTMTAFDPAPDEAFFARTG